MRPFTPILLVVLTAACAEPASRTEEPAPARKAPPVECSAPGLPQSGLRTGRVVVEGAGAEVAFAVEIAETNRQRAIGMMCRTALADDAGMLFVFEGDEPRSFWMKNTLIALDMVFIDADGRVVGVVERAEPLTLRSRGVPTPSTYVLELAGGVAKARGVVEGARVRFEGVHQRAPEAK